MFVDVLNFIYFLFFFLFGGSFCKDDTRLQNNFSR